MIINSGTRFSVLLSFSFQKNYYWSRVLTIVHYIVIAASKDFFLFAHNFTRRRDKKNTWNMESPMNLPATTALCHGSLGTGAKIRRRKKISLCWFRILSSFSSPTQEHFLCAILKDCGAKRALIRESAAISAMEKVVFLSQMGNHSCAFGESYSCIRQNVSICLFLA